MPAVRHHSERRRASGRAITRGPALLMVDPNPPRLGLGHLAPVPPWRARLPLLAVVAYVGALAIWVDGGTQPRGALVALAALAIAFVATRRASGVPRWLGSGVALVVASLGARA